MMLFCPLGVAQIFITSWVKEEKIVYEANIVLLKRIMAVERYNVPSFVGSVERNKS